MKIKFTKAEISHLMSLITFNESEGTYYGNKKQYFKRSIILKNKLVPPEPEKRHCRICGCNIPDNFIINTCYGCEILND
jgi:hypothetical protein